MKQLEKLLMESTSKITNLNEKINDFKNSFPDIKIDANILEQLNLNILLVFETLIPKLGIDKFKLQSIKESINYYKFNLDNGIDLNMLLIRDEKCEKLIADIKFLYTKSLEYKNEILKNYQEEKRQIEIFIEKIQKIINLVTDKKIIDLDNLNNQLLEINIPNDIYLAILKQALENNLNFYKHQEEVSIAEKDIKIVDEEEEAIQKKKEIYGIKPISDPKDEKFKNDLEVLSDKIKKLNENISTYLKLDSNLYILFSELNDLFKKVNDLKNDFLATYLAYKELYGELEKEELEDEFKRLKKNYELLENEFIKVEEQFNLAIKGLKVAEQNPEEIPTDLDINNWNFCRYLIFNNSTLNDFKKEFSKKTLSLSTVSTILQAFKNLVTVSDLSSLGAQEVKKVDLKNDIFEYRITNSNDGGAIRIFFIYYDENSLFVPKILFKVSDKQSMEEIVKIRKRNIRVLAKNYAQNKEEMTRELLEFIISRVKSYQTGEISVVEPNISGNVGEINDVRNNSK